MNNKIYSIKTIVVSGLIAFLGTVMLQTATAQLSYSKYFLNEMSGINKMNPAFVPEYGYLSFPVLGRFGMYANSTSGVSDFLFPMDGKHATFMNKAVSADDFLSRIDPNTTINQALSSDIFSFGFFTKRNSFWSFNVGFRENLHVNLPYDFFALAKKGMSNSYAKYDLNAISFQQTNIGDLSIGYSRMIGKKVRFGLNAKLLVGLSSAQFSYSKFDVIFNQGAFSVDAKGDLVMMADAAAFKKDENNIYKFDTFSFNKQGLKPMGYGGAVDLGITYNPVKKLTLSASVNDLGSLKWNSTSVRRAVAQGGVSFNGFTEIDAQNVNVDAQVDQLKEDAKTLIQFKDAEVTETYKYDLPTIIRASAEYSFFGNPSHDISVGMLYQNYSSVIRKTDELVGVINLRPFSWFMISGNAAMLTKDYNRYGVALSFSPCWFNFFIASDYVIPNLTKQFAPIDAFNLNFETGFSIPFGHSRRKTPKAIPVVLPAPPPPMAPVMPIPVIDSLVVHAKMDSDTIVVKHDTLVVIPPVDSTLIHAADSLRMKLQMDSIATQQRADSIASVALQIAKQVVVPATIPVATISNALPSTTTNGTKAKSIKKPIKGKATLNKKKKLPAKAATVKK
ncbi:MAG: DUF5723 family protein [Bacteroidales bacterium]